MKASCSRGRGRRGGALLHFCNLSIIVYSTVSFLLPLLVESMCSKDPVIFNFGDSNSDTGGYSAGLGIIFGPPNGRTFFNRSTGRISDGRLVIDFLCENLNTNYLTPYLESFVPNFKNGANFAIIGASTLPAYVPFSLDIQILQFLCFRDRSIKLVSQGEKNFVDEEGFQNAIYTFDIGQNDLAGDFSPSSTLTYDQIIGKIPSYIAEIKYALWSIYQHGGKNFWIHNTGPFGCLPTKLATTSHNDSDTDAYGCIKSLNNAAKMFNKGLTVLCEELRQEMRNATVVYTDIFAIKYDLIANSTNYGFINPFMACCGYGGPPYNVNASMGCGQTGYNVCDKDLKYISWDGVHYTEAANAMVASKILSTVYSTPHLKSSPLNVCRVTLKPYFEYKRKIEYPPMDNRINLIFGKTVTTLTSPGLSMRIEVY